jgi:hypothetical protein
MPLPLPFYSELKYSYGGWSAVSVCSWRLAGCQCRGRTNAKSGFLIINAVQRGQAAVTEDCKKCSSKCV